jgi:hypothetical protein
MIYIVSYAVTYTDETTFTGLCHVEAETEERALSLFWRMGAAFVGESDAEVSEIREIRLIKISEEPRPVRAGAIDSAPVEMVATR